ncbi:MAG TPA: LCP family protein [Patescibacteria group bacterium]
MRQLKQYLYQLKQWFRSLTLKQLIALDLFLTVLFLISAGLTYSYFLYQRSFVTSNESETILPQPSPSPEPNVDTIVLLGRGGAGHDGGLLTDSIMVARIDHDQQQITLISVPRDLWVELPVDKDNPSSWKINAAYAFGVDDRNYRNKPSQFTGEAGGGELAKYALEQVLGFPVEHFVTVDFYGFERAIDVLGGVTVNVERAFTDPLYPIEGKQDDTCGKTEEEIAALTATVSASKLEEEFTCRFEVLSFPQGTQLMDGSTALKYVRSRHSPTDGGDFNRAARQRNLLLAVKDRVLTIDFIPKIIPFISTISSHITTDISLTQMKEMVDEYEKVQDYEIKGIALTTDNVLELGVSSGGQSILMSKEDGEGKWEKLQEWLREEMASN